METKGMLKMKILRVVPNNGQYITAYFDNNHSIKIDMKDKLQTARFSNLRNMELFMAPKTDGRAILWSGGISIGISELMEMASR
jgi:hypothetical protein